MARTISWAFLGLTVVALLAGTAVAQQQLQQVEQEVQIEEDPFADDPQGNQAPQSPVPKLKPGVVRP